MRRAPSAASSAPRRDRMNASDRAPSSTRSARIRDVSAPAERRTGAPFSPVSSSSNGGSHHATARAPRGEASSVTARQDTPVNREANEAGEAVVAEASTKTGEAP